MAGSEVLDYVKKKGPDSSSVTGKEKSSDYFN